MIKKIGILCTLLCMNSFIHSDEFYRTEQARQADQDRLATLEELNRTEKVYIAISSFTFVVGVSLAFAAGLAYGDLKPIGYGLSIFIPSAAVLCHFAEREQARAQEKKDILERCAK